MKFADVIHVFKAKPKISGPTIAIINKSKFITEKDITPVIKALQTQLDRDFLPVWGLTATLIYAEEHSIPKDVWTIYLLDVPDTEGALGYHEKDTSGIYPTAKVFVGLDIQYKLSWTVTLSHELLEMVADPNINLTAFAQTGNTTGILFAYEVCDACENDKFGYRINGVLVSDFVYPSWFESFWKPKSVKFDHMGLVSKPFELIAGGYIGYFKVGPDSKGWQQTFADKPSQRFLLKQQRNSRTFQRIHKEMPVGWIIDPNVFDK